MIMDTSMGSACTGRRLRARTTRAFTLIELLVVIAIIVILVAILIPSVRYFMEHGYATTCRANLHSLSQLIHDKSPAGPGIIPNNAYWMGYLNTTAQDVFRCPKGEYEATGGGGVQLTGITPISTPSSLIFNTIESNTTIHGFYEQVGYTLPSNVTVDITQPGRYNNNYSSTSAVIPAGTIVNCYYLWFDPVGNSSQSADDRSVTLSGEILGIICQDQNLHDSDPILGMPGVDYPNPPADGAGARGFENDAEQVSLMPDMHTFYIHKMHSTFPGEQMRILTVPGQTSGSYAVNPLVDTTIPRPDQAMLVEYGTSILNLADAGEHAANLQPRHFDKVNVLFGDGSAKAIPVDQLDDVDGEIYQP